MCLYEFGGWPRESRPVVSVGQGSADSRSAEPPAAPAATDGGGHVPTSSAPGPRYQDVTIEGYQDLVDAAENLLDKKEVEWNLSAQNNLLLGARPGAGYNMAPGQYDRILVVVEANYDRRVPEAMADAMRARGADVDIVTIQKTMGTIDPWADELPGIHRGIVEGHPLLDMEGVRWWEGVAEDRYDLLVYGVGGPNRRLEDTDYQRIPWRTEPDLASAANEFPTPVWELINEKAGEVAQRAETVHLTDPEGTDVTFTNHDHSNVVGYIDNRAAPGHIFGHPIFLNQETDTTGVFAGTLNHAGAFPRVEIEVEDAKVVAVRGGGDYGERLREIMAETADLQYPSFPGPGLLWFHELAIGTNPKVARPAIENIDEVQFPEIERRRSGIIHCGFGTPYQPEPYLASLDDVPWGHAHVHLNFPTYEATMPDGETVTLIDEGRLTTLDDPEVRALAAEYGDPDELLSEDWIPAVPGINVEGDYMADYGEDPMTWIKQEMAP